MSEKRIELPPQIVDLTSPGWNARIGRYFIGQTGELHFGNQLSAWAGIINPKDSGVNVYFDIFTITNFGENSFDAEIWLDAEPPCGENEPSIIVPSNQSINPPPKPKAYMQNADYLLGDPVSGIDIFGRIVSPNSTLVSDSHQGSIIIGEGGTFSIILKAPEQKMVTATIVLTWWEEPVGRRK